MISCTAIAMIAIPYTTRILLFVDRNDLRFVNANDIRIKTDGIKLSNTINSSNTVWYLDVNICSSNRYVIEPMTAICDPTYRYRIIRDKCEVDFLSWNAILTEILRRKTWIKSETRVITEYITIFWNELRSFMFKAQVSPALMSIIWSKTITNPTTIIILVEHKRYLRNFGNCNTQLVLIKRTWYVKTFIIKFLNFRFNFWRKKNNIIF